MGRWAPGTRHALLLHTWLPPYLTILAAEVLGQWILHSLGMTEAVIQGNLKRIYSSLEINGTYPYVRLCLLVARIYPAVHVATLHRNGQVMFLLLFVFLNFFLSTETHTHTHTFMLYVYKPNLVLNSNLISLKYL